jgi:hypothetical protein
MLRASVARLECRQALRQRGGKASAAEGDEHPPRSLDRDSLELSWRFGMRGGPSTRAGFAAKAAKQRSLGMTRLEWKARREKLKT